MRPDTIYDNRDILTSHGSILQRQHALQIAEAGIKSVIPYESTKKYINLRGRTLTVGTLSFDLDNIEHIYVVGVGKGSYPIALAIDDILGDRITEGFLVVKEGEKRTLPHIKVFESSHPFPDQRSVTGALRIKEILEKAIKAVQKLDPIGCATSDFRESLAVQAEIYASFSKNPEEQRQYNLLSRILREHFSCFEKGRTEVFIRNLKKESGIQISLEEGKSLLELLRTLTPFPGRAFPSGQTLGDFTGDGAQYIVPDIFVKKEGEEFSIRINDEEIPVIGISPFFMKLGKDSGQGKQTRDFARESLQEARWFMNSLKKRNLTVMKVARVIVLFQKDFFNKGPKFLHPMKLKDVADETGLHEATVSRAASGKYLQCEWGIFELRYFFSGKAGTPSSLNKDGGTSKQSAKEIIREIIENSPGKPTDREIMELLSQKGINIARRTVAKYRNELSIGSSFDR